jgi:hypothetical protein
LLLSSSPPNIDNAFERIDKDRDDVDDADDDANDDADDDADDS